MRTLVIVFLTIIIVAGIFSSAFAGDIPNRRIGVIEDVNITGNYSGNASQHLAARVETRLQDLGWTMLARGEKFGHLQQEQNLNGIDPRTAPQKNKIWGTTNVIKINAEIDISEDYRSSNLTIAGWTSSGSSIQYVARGVVNLQVVNSTTGQIVSTSLPELVKSFSVPTSSYLSTPYGSIGGNGGTGNVREILGKLMLDLLADAACIQLSEKLTKLGDEPSLNSNPATANPSALPADPVKNFWQLTSDLVAAGGSREKPIVLFSQPVKLGSKWVIAQTQSAQPVAVVEVASSPNSGFGGVVYSVKVLGGAVPGSIQQGQTEGYKIIKYSPPKK